MARIAVCRRGCADKRDTVCNSLRGAVVSLLLPVLVACNGMDDRSAPHRLGGSVGDGPVVDAWIDVITVKGRRVASGTGDEHARYEITLPEDVKYPVLLRATGGTDLVTGRPLDFGLLTVVFDASQPTANITPFSTVAILAAQCMEGGLTPPNLARAWMTPF